jgi:hypothetical protein
MRGRWIACSSWCFCVVACRGEPPVANVDAAVAPLPLVATARAAERADASTNASSSTGTSASADAGAGAVDPPDGGDPGALEQTRDKPPASGAAFESRAAALWDGIVHDDPDRAMPFFFPVSAYEQVKAIGNPASDWRRRLVANYKRDIHALHKRLGDDAEAAKLVRADIPDDRARWVDPGEEYNKLGYWRVYGTRLVYSVDGKERSFDVSSLISWRGEWYVVHLTGFK